MDHPPTISTKADMPEPTGNMRQATQQRLRSLWDSIMRNPSKAVRHDKTSVLLLSWDPEHDDLACEEEVSSLGRIFEETYGFKVVKALLKAEKPGQQALKDVSAFVHQEDNERSLLIIYYAGHGFGGENAKPGDIHLIGRKVPQQGSDAETKMLKQKIVWSTVETAILQAEADVLLIFDCCQAGRLCKPYRSAEPSSHYQFLGACAQDEVTAGPGEESFTSALIWALKELASEEAPFSTRKLHAKIMKYPQMPNDQIPVITNRELRDVLGDIVICRKNLKHEPTEMPPTKLERTAIENRAYLDLRLVFESDVDDKKLEETAEALKDFRDGTAGTKLKLSQIRLQGKYTALEHAALRFRDATSRRPGPESTPATATPSGDAVLTMSGLRNDNQQTGNHANSGASAEQAIASPEAAGPTHAVLALPPNVEATRPSSEITKVGEGNPSIRNEPVTHHLWSIALSIREIFRKLVPGRGAKKTRGLPKVED